MPKSRVPRARFTSNHETRYSPKAAKLFLGFGTGTQSDPIQLDDQDLAVHCNDEYRSELEVVQLTTLRELLRNQGKVVFVTGAGISTSAGGKSV